MLPKQLKAIKESLESLKNLDDKQKELLNELNFINKNTELEKDIKENYTFLKKIMESFSVASDTCPACGKRK